MSELIHGPKMAPAVIAGGMRDASYMDTYANQLRIAATLSDLTLIFGIAEDVGPNTAINKDRVAVRLAPTTMKILLLNLQMMTEAYEESVGNIPISPRIFEQLPLLKEGLKKNLAEQMHPATAASQSTK